MCQVSPPMQWEVDQIEAAFASAVLSGVTPDLSHLNSGGYHVCLNHLWSHGFADDYSNTRTNDESPPVTVKGRVFSAAHDISLGVADMKRWHANVRRVWLDKTDPRRFAVNAINCWDGSGDAVRYDFPAQTATYATPDHRWHAHSESPRLMVDIYADEKRAWKAARARVSIITGQSKAAWLAAEANQPAGPASQEDDMPTVDEFFNADRIQRYDVNGKEITTGNTHMGFGYAVGYGVREASLARVKVEALAAALAKNAAEEAARDAAQTALLQKLAGATGNPLSDAQFAQALEAMKAAAAEAGKQAVDRLEQRLATAAQAEADALAAPQG